MARIARMVVKGEEVVYHVITKTALEGFVLGDVEKEYLTELIKWMSSVYFTEVYGFCVMGNHMHLLVKMKDGDGFDDDDIRARMKRYYKGEERLLTSGQMPFYRARLSNLSEYVKDIKQRFSRYYNKEHNRSGYFWGDRFKSVIVESGDTLVNCLAYIDLNPVRAGIVERPEEYRWSSLGYHIQSGNRDDFLSTDFGLSGYGEMSKEERIRSYREYVYEKGAIETKKGKPIDKAVAAAERDKGYRLTIKDRLRYKTRYFSDSGIIGTKGFVNKYYLEFKSYFNGQREKSPREIQGLDNIYSLKNLLKES